jgi:hypothetical protein
MPLPLDEKTIASALINHSARVKADVGILIASDGKLIASDQAFGLQIVDEFNNLKEQAQVRGQAYDIIIVDGRAYQFVMFSVKAPVVIGLAAMGFEIKQDLSVELQRLTGLEVSFVIHDGKQYQYLSGTQDEKSHVDLLQQMQTENKQGEVFVYDELISLAVPAARQNNDLLAVLQVPLSQVLAPFSRLNVQLFLFSIGGNCGALSGAQCYTSSEGVGRYRAQNCRRFL